MSYSIHVSQVEKRVVSGIVIALQRRVFVGSLIRDNNPILALKEMRLSYDLDLPIPPESKSAVEEFVMRSWAVSELGTGHVMGLPHPL
jgi:hypothetical protein